MSHSHDHSHDHSSFYLEQLCTIVVCGLLGIVAVMLTGFAILIVSLGAVGKARR